MEIPEEVLESLTLIDSVQVSSQAMVELLRTVNRYVEGKHSYRRTLAYQARQYAQALLAKNEEMYEPISLRWQSCQGCCYFLEKPIHRV